MQVTNKEQSIMPTPTPDYVQTAVSGFETARDQLLINAKYLTDATRKVVGSAVQTAQPDVQGALDFGFDVAEKAIARQRALANSVLQSVNRLVGV
jgi:hypothetical protein